MFYARLTESARRFGFSMSEPKSLPESKKPKDRKSDERPILQRRVTQLEKAKNWRFSAEHYRKIVTETAAIEEASPEMMAALPKQNLSRPLDAEELLDLLNQTEEKLIYAMEGADAFEALAPSQPSEWTSDDLTVRKRDRRKAGLTRPADEQDAPPPYSADRTEGRGTPQTAQTTPGLLSPQSESQNVVRRHRSFDSSQGRRLQIDSEKVLIPDDIRDSYRHGAGGVHIWAQNHTNHTRSHSMSGPEHPQGISSPDINEGRSQGITITPSENISGVRDIVGSPETYNESQDSLASVATTISVTDDNGQTATPPPIPTTKPSDSKQEHMQSTSQTESRTENLDPYAADLGLKFRVMTPKSLTRAYWLLVDVDDKLPKGTLVWVDESAAKPFMDGEHRINVTRYTGDPSAWVSKSVLKPGRYYALKERQRMVADGDTVKLARDQIVVPLEDDSGTSPDELELTVVPLDQKWSVVVEKDWLREVNLTMPMPP
ncbi:hypothetical protein ABW21_db0209125 [Orbilia brochopaga]|nr:hypothetical protein ABW21_db0209125 [Drechslerella brochopaga]